MLWRWGKLEFKSTWHYCGESKEQLCSWLPAVLTCFKWSWRYFMLQDWSLLSTVCFIKLDADCSRHNLWWLETQSAVLAPDHCVQTELGRELRVCGGGSIDPRRNDPSPSGPMLSSHSSLACLARAHSQGETRAPGTLHLTLQNPLQSHMSIPTRQEIPAPLWRPGHPRDPQMGRRGQRETALNKLNHFRAFLNANMAICKAIYVPFWHLQSELDAKPHEL